MQRALVGVLLFALAVGVGFIALRAARRRNQAIMGGFALLLVLAAAGVLWWPFGGTPAPLASSVRLYVGTHDSMVALQASTGSVVWTFPAAFGTGQLPAVVGGVAYYVVPESGVMPESGTVYAINAKNGSLLWHTRLNGAGGYSTPAVDGGVVYVSSVKGVDALNARDGSHLWHVELDTSASNPSAPTLTNGMLYFGAGWQRYPEPPPPTAACLCLYALRASDGSVVWTYPTSDFVYDAPTVVDGVVYGSDVIDGLFALRASDGKVLWTRPDTEGGSPTVVQGVVYVSRRDDHLTHALSARDGSQIWQGGPVGPLTVSDGVVYIGVTAGLVALRASDGTHLWDSRTSYDTHHLFSAPVVSQGVVFVRVYCTNGSIFCQDQVLALKASDGSVYWSKTLVLPSDPVLDMEQTSPAG